MLPRTTSEMLNVRSRSSSITLGAPIITCSPHTPQQHSSKLNTHAWHAQVALAACATPEGSDELPLICLLLPGAQAGNYQTPNTTSRVKLPSCTKACTANKATQHDLAPVTH
jgi:hypothetical protein